MSWEGRAWTLEAGRGGVATLRLHVPETPVNLLTPAVLDELDEVIRGLDARRDTEGLVIASGCDRSWIAGADVKAMAPLRDPESVRLEVMRGQRVFAALERLEIPVVAAISGVALGGGTELALACTARVAADDDGVELGLPETQLGILPAWGGTQRLPRLVGLTRALDLILTGRRVGARRARAIGLVDEVVDPSAIEVAARDLALGLAAGRWSRRSPRSTIGRWLLDHTSPGRALALSKARQAVLARTAGRYPAPLHALEAIRLGAAGGDGFLAEANAAAELLSGDVAHHLIDLFLLREGSRVDGAEADPPGRIAVIGAGVMGSGIAQASAFRGLEAHLRDVSLDRVSVGMRVAWRGFDRAVRRRRLDRTKADERMQRILPGVGLGGLRGCDLVVEAVVEDLGIKHSVLRELEATTGPGTLLATNTSSLRLDAIAEGLDDAARLVGIHFFNPVHRMPLVEVVRGPRTSSEAVARAVAFVRKLGKTPVIVADSPGFLVNRILMPYLSEAMLLVDEGVAPEAVDLAATSFGMPMGPLRVLDEVGLEVAESVAAILRESAGDRALAQPRILASLRAEGCLGRKGGRGFYDYPRKGEPTPRRLPGVEAGPVAPESMIDRLILPMVNEAARALLEDHVVATAAELDLAMVMGTGFPPFRGGLLAWADARGLDDVVGGLRALGGHPRFAPCASLVALAGSGGSFRYTGEERSAGEAE